MRSEPHTGAPTKADSSPTRRLPSPYRATRVLDCSSGTGQLAVGLASLGLDVVATDASAGMVRRIQELADEHSVPLQALRVAWDDLPDYLDPSTFDLVICVGNSLCHAQGTSGRLAALAAMSRLLNPRGAWCSRHARGSSCALEALGLTSVIGSSAAETVVSRKRSLCKEGLR